MVILPHFEALNDILELRYKFLKNDSCNWTPCRIGESLEVYICLEKPHLFSKTCPLGRQQRKNLQKPDDTAFAGQSTAVIWPPCLWSEIIGSSSCNFSPAIHKSWRLDTLGVRLVGLLGSICMEGVKSEMAAKKFQLPLQTAFMKSNFNFNTVPHFNPFFKPILAMPRFESACYINTSFSVIRFSYQFDI